ncbi:MAG TPA: hypothetical protein VIT64_12265 [Ilumatobacteraceae bacterium]
MRGDTVVVVGGGLWARRAANDLVLGAGRVAVVIAHCCRETFQFARRRIAPDVRP